MALLVGGAQAARADLESEFHDVPVSSRPWAYWWWLNGNVDEETITRDLEAMKRVGFGGLLMFDARGYWDDKNHVVLPRPKMGFMSGEWRQLLRFGIEEAARLGLEVSVNLSSCAGRLKGPWPVGSDAPKRLVWQATPLEDGKTFRRTLRKPADRKYFRVVATFGVKYGGADVEPMDGWLDAGDGPHDSWSGKRIGGKAIGVQRTALEVVDLADRIDARGRLTWQVPSGRWALLRFGYTTIDGHEYDVDMMDPVAVEGHFDRMAGAIMSDVGPLAGKTLTHFYSVSWEGAVPTWTGSLEQDFARYRGYAIRPWLPVLAGFVVEDQGASRRFVLDYRRARNDVFRDNFYGTMRGLCHRHGLKWHSESGGPWNRNPAVFGEADQLAFLARNDMPQGEFWYMGKADGRGRQLSRAQAMTAHVYGRRLAAAEAFTHMVRHWTAYPAVLKRCGDESFCDGVNHLIWHTFTCSPEAFGLPGSEYFAGTHINPNVTWFEQAAPFVTYLGRCQHLLRQGRFVADVCVFTGDVPYQHWGRHTTKWSAKASMELPPGYAYDIINSEVLTKRASVEDGRVVLPGGMSYELLAVDLDSEQVSLPALRKIADLKAAGATVVFGTRKPKRAPGMTGITAGHDDEVLRLGEELWAGTATLEQALRTKQRVPDFEGPFDYTHRRDGETNVYFVAGTGVAKCTFRLSGRQPELWDPVAGSISDVGSWLATADGRTRFDLELPESGSVFVVFRRPGQPRLVPAGRKPVGEMVLSGPWEVRFMPDRGAPEMTVFPSLKGWDEHPDPGIRHFSGMAMYLKQFDLTERQASGTVWLELGAVAALAQVRLNGKDLGIAWTAPWRVSLTSAVRAGPNILMIEVTNTWANRLIGDAGLPPEERITRSNLQYEKGKRTLRGFQGYASEDRLQPSGLRGPVKLVFF